MKFNYWIEYFIRCIVANDIKSIFVVTLASVIWCYYAFDEIRNPIIKFHSTH